MKSTENFQKKDSSNKPTGANELCYKCGKLGYFIRDCPLHKIDYQKYLKFKGVKAKKKDRARDKSRRKASIEYVVKQALVAWGDSLSKSNK